MARITVEDCLTKIPNRFTLVNMVAKRVRQIREGSEYLVSSPKNEDVVVSLREIAAGKVFLKPENEPEEVPTISEEEPETEPKTEPETEKEELAAKV
ncbi:MAG: DNA-directed RNA polymerase subunit omega [Deltaproteobacteria bacterium]|nr:DNA-directed RNA polymerase subunit omega [Deltaproteobacteria bacterium]